MEAIKKELNKKWVGEDFSYQIDAIIGQLTSFEKKQKAGRDERKAKIRKREIGRKE